MTGFGAWGMPGGGFNWNMLTGLGAGMLANAEYSPGQAFGKGYNQAMQGGLDMAKQQLMFQEYDQRRRQQQQMEQLRKELLPMLTGQGQQPPPTAGGQLGAGAPTGDGFATEFPNTAGALGMQPPAQAAPQQMGPTSMSPQLSSPPVPGFDAQRYQQLIQGAAKAKMFGQDDIAASLQMEAQRMATMYDQGIKGGEFKLKQEQEKYDRFNDNRSADLAERKYHWDTVGKGREERYQGTQTAGRSAQTRMGKLKVMEQALADPNFYSGEGGAAVLRLKRLGAALGLAKADGIASAEQFHAMTKEDVLARIGGTLGSQISNSDRQFMVETGQNIGFSKEGNRRLAEISKRLTQREIEVAEMARDYKKKHGELDDGFDQLVHEHAEANPLFGDGVPGAGGTTPNSSNAPLKYDPKRGWSDGWKPGEKSGWINPGEGITLSPTGMRG